MKHAPLQTHIRIEMRLVTNLNPYAHNARTHSAQQVAQIAASIKEFGWTNPILIDGDYGVIAGHARLLAAQKLGMTEVPVIVLGHLTSAQRKALVLADNKLALNAGWDEDLLRLELAELQALKFDLDLTGFAPIEIDELLRDPMIEERADLAPPLPEIATTRAGDLWLLGKHRVLCGDSTNAEAVGRLLNGSRPLLMVTDPPYGVELDSEWRDRAGINKRGPAEPSYMKRRIEGHTQTKISGDTIADWSPAFSLVPSLQVAYVWHASRFTSEVLAGLLRIGFIHHQQIIWRKSQAALTRTHYWFSHEPAWYVRKKNAPWFGRPGENTTVWDAASPKMIMGGSSEEKFDHPTQKPVELMRRPILNHLKRGELVFDPFLGSGTTLAAAEVTERVCYGMELDPRYVDVVVERWQELTGKEATLDALAHVRAGQSRAPGRSGMNHPKGGKRPSAGRKAVKIDLAELEKLCSLQCTDQEIASFFSVSVRTIERRKKKPAFAEVMERGRAKGRMSVRRTLFSQAGNGNIAAAIFLAKNLLGYKDYFSNEHSGPDGGPIPLSLIEALQQRRNRLASERKGADNGTEAPVPGTKTDANPS